MYSPNTLSAKLAPKKGVVYATAVEMETYDEATMEGMSAFQSSLYLLGWQLVDLQMQLQMST